MCLLTLIILPNLDRSLLQLADLSESCTSLETRELTVRAPESHCGTQHCNFQDLLWLGLVLVWFWIFYQIANLECNPCGQCPPALFILLTEAHSFAIWET